MPELSEVETARRGIERAMKDKTVSKLNITRRDLRIPVPANMADVLEGRKCTKLLRRGKYIIIEFSGNKTAILHLGMSGRIRIYDPKQKLEQQKHDHIILTLHDSTTIVFHDPRRFGFFYLAQGKDWRNEKSFLNWGRSLWNNGPAQICMRHCAIKSHPSSRAYWIRRLSQALGIFMSAKHYTAPQFILSAYQIQ